jgi:hypothetical protein
MLLTAVTHGTAKFTQRLKETRGITPCKKDGDRAWRGVTFRNINEDGEIIDLTRTERTDRTRFPPSVKITEYQNSREE